MAKTIVGLFDTSTEAQNVVQQLVDGGFSRDSISVLANNRDGYTPSDTTATAEGAGAGAVGGGVLGGVLGLLVGVGALAIPGIGPVLAAGPLAAALGAAGASTLVGAGIGAAAGGIIGALVGAGIPEEDAGFYAEGVRRGGTLVMVQASDEVAQRAYDIMNSAGAVDVERRSGDWRGEGWNGFDPAAEGDNAWERSSKVGTTGGAVAGAATGAAMGSVAGPVGTVIGGAAGAVTGAVVGAAGDTAGEKATEGAAYDTTPVDRVDGTDVSSGWGASTGATSGQFNSPMNTAAGTDSEIGSDASSNWEESSKVGTAGGAVAGAATGAAIGAVGGPVGMAIGGVAGAATGAVAGAAGDAAGEAAEDSFSSYDSDFRTHYETYGTASGYDYDQYTPVYRYGYNLATDPTYRERDWADVEGDARRRWEERNPGTWDRFKDSVRYAWDKARGAI